MVAGENKKKQISEIKNKNEVKNEIQILWLNKYMFGIVET